MFIRCAFIIPILFHQVHAQFSADFADWITTTYGDDVRNRLIRADLGAEGSFGGRTDRQELIQRQPVVFVHGVSDVAGRRMRQAAEYYRTNGYSYAELYATTYADGDQGNPLQWLSYSMQCAYVKQVRALIVAVRLYTGRAVDVVGYSLGVPIARKAILGGNCVDTGEYLGSPLTRFIDTFVGIAGPNHGISLQVGGISIPGCVLALIPVCNTLTGLYSGICPHESRFLNDINAQPSYEGAFVYSIYTKTDQLVGYTVCDKITAQIPGQHGEKIYDDKDHDRVLFETFEVQRQMVLDHVII